MSSESGRFHKTDAGEIGVFQRGSVELTRYNERFIRRNTSRQNRANQGVSNQVGRQRRIQSTRITKKSLYSSRIKIQYRRRKSYDHGNHHKISITISKSKKSKLLLGTAGSKSIQLYRQAYLQSR